MIIGNFDSAREESYLVSDPDSLNRKAAKARTYGIPIINEAVFARLFDSYVQSARDEL